MSYANFKPTFWSKHIQHELPKFTVFKQDCDFKFEGEAGEGKRLKIQNTGRPTIKKYTPGKEIDGPENVAGSSAYLDIDQNGSTELLVGEVGTYGGDTGMFFDLYTIVDHQVVQVAASQERDRYYLCKDGLIYNEGSGGAEQSFYSYYGIGGDGQLILTEAVLFDSAYGGDSPWFYSTSNLDVAQASVITQAAAQEIMDKHALAAISFTPLSTPSAEDSSHSEGSFNPDDYVFLCPNFDYDDPTFRGDDAYYWEETYGAWVLKELKGDPAGISDYLTMCQLMWEETGGKGYSDPTGLVEDPLLPYAEISDPSEGTYDPSIDANWSEEYELWIPAKIYGDSEEMLAYYEKLIAIGEANYASEN